jgi:hypothetical protein
MNHCVIHSSVVVIETNLCKIWKVFFDRESVNSARKKITRPCLATIITSNRCQFMIETHQTVNLAGKNCSQHNSAKCRSLLKRLSQDAQNVRN